MIRLVAALFILLSAPTVALAASPADPVRRMMDIAAARLDENATPEEYFSDQRLARDFSRRFVAAYRAAGKYPAYDDGSDNPFDYDVIAGGQDGCPLEAVEIGAPVAEGVRMVVPVSFRLWACLPADDPTRDSVNQVFFDVVAEDGRPVIDDIHRVRDGQRTSLIAELGEIVRAGQENESTAQ